MFLFLLSPQAGICCYYEPGVDDAWDPTQECQDDVDEQGAGAAFAQEDGEGWEEDCYYCFAAADLGSGLLVRREWVAQEGGTYDHHVCGIDLRLSPSFFGSLLIFG
jgi:hypothetical protein